MLERPDGIMIYEDGDKNVRFENALYVLNRNIQILTEKLDRITEKREEHEKTAGTNEIPLKW